MGDLERGEWVILLDNSCRLQIDINREGTPSYKMGDALDSWVDLAKECSPVRLPPPFGELPDYLAMLREAQGETSCRVSPILTRRPSSCCDEEVAMICSRTSLSMADSDWASLHEKRWGEVVDDDQEDSPKVMAGLLLSNLLSLLLGAGIGICIYRRARTSDLDI